LGSAAVALTCPDRDMRPADKAPSSAHKNAFEKARLKRLILLDLLLFRFNF
jgi:hypothetical protein